MRLIYTHRHSSKLNKLKDKDRRPLLQNRHYFDLDAADVIQLLDVANNTTFRQLVSRTEDDLKTQLLNLRRDEFPSDEAFAKTWAPLQTELQRIVNFNEFLTVVREECDHIMKNGGSRDLSRFTELNGD